MVQISGLFPTHTPEICKTIQNEISKEHAVQNIVQVSKIASNCVSNMQQGIISAQKTFPKLNRHSFYCGFFGTRSEKTIQQQFENQMALTWIKTREQNLEHFPPIVMSSPPDAKFINRAMKNLKEKKFGRLTVSDKIFSKNGEEGNHTVGLVYNNDKLIILDSIPETYPEIKDLHKRLINILGVDSDKVIFPNLPQQSFEEYTCNNWTHANLDSVIDYLNGNGKSKELSSEILEEILPDNINKILYNQYLYVDNNLKGRDLSDYVIEVYKK